MGHKVLGDVHLGDWGYQMGLIITELKKRNPELSYFDEAYEGEYPEEAPFTISELEEIYPAASAYAKEHEITGKRRFMRPGCSRKDTEGMLRCGSILSGFPWRILRKTMSV